MSFKIAINGFGRIGRLAMRAFYENPFEGIEIVAINDLCDIKDQAHLLQYDSIHGRFPNTIKTTEDTIDIGFGPIKVFQKRNPEDLPWKDLDIDLVFECSGIFTKHVDASKHLKAGAKRVLISAPSPDADRTIVYGVNHKDLKIEDKIISNASCTTNCLAPVAKVLDDVIGISHGYMTTIHAFTADQRLVDTSHKDMRRARSATQSMIPTSTGAAKAVGLILPKLKGKLDGTAIRVPTPNVSLVDFTFVSEKETTIDQINSSIIEASKNSLKGVLEVCDKPLVSIDFNHNSNSSIFDIEQTQVVEKTFCRVVSWYDNEWGFANRMNDVANFLYKMQ